MAKAIKTAVIAALIVVTGGAIAMLTPFGPAAFSAVLSAATMTFATTLVAAGVGMLTSKGVDATNNNFGTKFSNRSPSAPRQIIYGKTRVGGTIVHIETTGTDNYLLHMIIAVAGHEVEDIETVRFNDKNLTTTTSSISGSTVYTVTNADYTNTDNDNNFGSGRLVRFTKKLGTDAQTADGFANAQLSSITSNDRFRGTAYVYIQMVFDAEKFGSGIPAISFIVKGKKVYDPRTSTTVWSDNPALCIRDFITDTRYGLNANSDEVNDSTSAGGFASAANICDQLVTLADGTSTETKYTANGFTNMSANGEGILEGLLSACAGKMSYTNGKFNLFAGAAQTPTLTITDDDLLAPVSISTKPQSGELYNTVKSIYVDSSNSYQGTESPVYQSSTFLTEDTPSGSSSANYVKELEMQLPFTTSVTMAQRIQRIGLNSNRQTTSVSLLTTTKFMRLQPNDWVYITNERLGYSSKVFEVVSMNLEIVGEDVPVAATRLVLQETESSIYTFAAGDYQTAISEGATLNTGNFTISPPSGLTTSVSTNNNFNVNNVNITVSWTNAPAQVVMGTEIQYKLSTDSTYEDHTFSARGVTSTVIRALEVGKTYNIRIRHVAVWNVFSTYVSTTQATGGTALNSGDIDNTQITINTDGTLNYDGSVGGTPDINSIIDSGNTKTGGSRAFAALDASNRLTTSIFSGVTAFSAAELINVRGAFANISTTPLLNVNNANTGLRNSYITTKADGTLNYDGTAAVSPDINSITDTGNTKTYAGYAGTGLDSSGRLKTSIISGASTFSAAELLNVRGAFANVGTTPLLNVANANTGLRNTQITTKADGTLNYDGTAAVSPNVDSITGVANFQSRVTTGLTASGILDTTVPVLKGGTGETNTNKFLNSGITVSQGSSGVFTLNRGDGTTDTTTITKSLLGLNYTDGATVGAVAGTNLKDSANNTLGDNDIKNTAISIDSSSNSLRLKIGASVFSTLSGITQTLVGLSGVTNNADQTSANTAAAISGQGALATLNTADFATRVSGTAKPENNATVGAIAGTNLKDSSSNVLGDTDVKNSVLGVSFSGQNFAINTSSTNASLDNSSIENASNIVRIKDSGVTTAKVADNSISGFVAASGSQYYDYNDFYPDGSASETRLGYAYQSGTGSGGSIYFPYEAVMVETGIMLTPSSGTTSILVIGHTINNVDAASSSDFITLRLQWRYASTSGGVSSANYSDVRLYTMYGASAESFQTLTGTVPSAFTTNNYYYQFRLTMRASGVTTLAGTTRSYGPATVMALTTVK